MGAGRNPLPQITNRAWGQCCPHALLYLDFRAKTQNRPLSSWKGNLFFTSFLLNKEMIHLKSLKLQIPPALKVIIVVCYTVLLALLVSCSVYEVYHFPRIIARTATEILGCAAAGRCFKQRKDIRDIRPVRNLPARSTPPEETPVSRPIS